MRKCQCWKNSFSHLSGCALWVGTVKITYTRIPQRPRYCQSLYQWVLQIKHSSKLFKCWLKEENKFKQEKYREKAVFTKMAKQWTLQVILPFLTLLNDRLYDTAVQIKIFRPWLLVNFIALKTPAIKPFHIMTAKVRTENGKRKSGC